MQKMEKAPARERHASKKDNDPTEDRNGTGNRLFAPEEWERIMRCSEKVLYVNGNIVTMDAEDRHAEAVLTCGDRIEAVGTAAELRPLAGPAHREVDLQGKTLYPGFIDTHSHIEMYAAWVAYAYCGGTETMQEALDILQHHAGAHPEQSVIMGYGYDDTATRDGRGPTVAELDALFGDRPTGNLS